MASADEYFSIKKYKNLDGSRRQEQTHPDGTKLITHFGKARKQVRQERTHPDGSTVIMYYDKDGDLKIKKETRPDGSKVNSYFDTYGNEVHRAEANPDGTDTFGLDLLETDDEDDEDEEKKGDDPFGDDDETPFATRVSDDILFSDDDAATIADDFRDDGFETPDEGIATGVFIDSGDVLFADPDTTKSEGAPEGSPRKAFLRADSEKLRTSVKEQKRLSELYREAQLLEPSYFSPSFDIQSFTSFALPRGRTDYGIYPASSLKDYDRIKDTGIKIKSITGRDIKKLKKSKKKLKKSKKKLISKEVLYQNPYKRIFVQ